jgi:multidrug efflux pump
MLARFFIDRPIFATVVSVVITLTGLIALASLPIAQYPQITPPSVSLSISYPGANAQVVADTIAAPVEQAVNGVQGMLYMSSTSGSDGSYTLSITFDVGTNLNTALVMVQNRVALALPLLPSQVQSQGITVRKKSPDQLMIVSFYSSDPNFIDRDLSNFALINLKDELLRVPGVSDLGIMGERDYSIRVWLDPRRLASRGMTAMDVADAVRAQNIQAAAGQTGQPPSPKRQSSQLPIDTLGRLITPEQFGDIIVKVSPGDFGAAAASADAAAGASDSSLPSPTTAAPIQGLKPAPSASSSSTSSSSSSSTSSSSTSSSSTSSSSTSSSSTSGGVASSGGATSTGGGTTGGGANSTGGGTGIQFPSTTSSGTSNSLTADTASTSSSTSGASTTPGSGNVLTVSDLPTDGAQGPSTSIVRLRDVAEIELGAANYSQYSTYDFNTAVGVNVFQLPGTNALDVADAVRQRIKELEPGFPPWLKYEIGYDTTPFIRESIADVIRTLFEAIVLVGVVVLVFLQDWRAMILPMIDVPVSLIGTFAVMAILGYSLNNISLFGLVLAIGIVVDDAIVVLENIERQMANGLDTRSATIKAMEEITGPILAITLVLCAVFVPCAFIPGITGRFFRQFAVTISASMIISAINAMTMTPSRALLIFKKQTGHTGHGHRAEVLPWWSLGLGAAVLSAWLWPQLAFTGDIGLPELPVGEEVMRLPDWLYQALPLDPATVPQELTATTVPAWLYWTFVVFHALPGLVVGLLVGWFAIRPLNRILGWLLQGFNRALDGATAFYAWTIGLALRWSALVLLAYLGLVGVTCWAFTVVPSGFIPEMDQGRLVVNVQLPDALSLELTKAVTARVDQIAHDNPGVAHTITNVGSGGGGVASNWASMFVILKPFEERRSPNQSAKAIINQLKAAWDRLIPEAKVTVNGAAPIPGLSQSGGFKLIVEDIGGLGLKALQEQTETLTSEMAQQSYLNNVVTTFRPHTPQLLLQIDRDKVEALGVQLSDVNQTVEIYLGSSAVNSFNEFGRTWQVTLQATGDFRTIVEDVGLLQVRNSKGQMVPLSVLIKLIPQDGPLSQQRYNLHSAASITGNLQQGVSSGEAISNIDRAAARLRQPGMGTEWTELMFLQIRAGNTALFVFALAVLCVFLSLAALYESWTMPLAVILVVPMCLLCALAGVWATKDSVNIFVQIGLVVLVGLACKNAILVVEFAQQLHRGGKSRAEAAVEASRLRLRPILMTSFAFILGVVPLVLATGAGAEMRRSLGTAMFSGMIGVTVFGIFLTPVFFYSIQGLGEGRWFQSFRVRRAASWLLGGMLGAAGGWFLAELGLVPLPWGPLVGAAGGVLVVLAVLDAHRRWWSE